MRGARRGARGAAFLSALLLATTAPAQQQAPVQPPSGQQPPTFQSGTQVVQVDVRVFAKDGHFVTDLKPEDFEVKEDGVPQPIGDLALIGAEPGTQNQNPNPGTPNRTPEPPNPRTPEPEVAPAT